MARTPQHTYQILTKRPARMRSWMRDVGSWIMTSARTTGLGITGDALPMPLPNVWLGVSVEDQKRADLRVPALLDTPAAVRFLSCEPLLGPVDLKPYLWPELGLHWVIVGGESGPGARPMHPDWCTRIGRQCLDTGTSFFFKQWGEWSPMAPLDGQGRFDWSGAHSLADDGTLYEPGTLAWPDGPRTGEAIRANHGRAHLTHMYRVGKKAAGRELDGKTWDQYPAAAS